MLITSFRISEQLTSSAFDDNNLMGRAYVRRGEVLVLMLGGGDKSTQQADIAAAQLLAASLED